MKKSLFILSIVLLFAGCTQNERAKLFGGSATETLPANTKLVNVTWKEANLWILTRPMRTNEVAEKYEFAERSNFGLMEGKITIVESK